MKKFFEALKMFKGVKNVVLLKCNKCGSIDVRLVNTYDTTKKEMEIGEFESVGYGIACNRCDTVAYVEEMWLMEKRDK